MDPKTLTAKETAYDVRDPRVPGLLMRVLPTGKRDWYYQVARGKRVRIGPYPLVNATMARAEPQKILQRLALGEDPKPEWLRAAILAPKGVTLKELADAYGIEFKALKRAQGFEPRSLEVLTTIINAVGTEFAATFDVRAWQTSLVKKRSAKTANRKLDALRSLYTWALAKGLVESNPTDGVKRLKVGNVTRERVRIPDTAAEARLRRALKGYAATAYVFARNTGLRLGELRRLRREDIDGDRVYVPVAKSGKGRFVPLNATARKALAKCPRDGLLFPHAFKRAWLKARTDADFAFTWNEATRHAFVSALLRAGVAPFTVSKLAGHADLSMLNVYGHALHDDLAAAVERLAS